MNFGQAIEEAKAGKRIQRAGWNGKNMWVALVPGADLRKHQWVYEHCDGFNSPSPDTKVLPFFVMYTAQGAILPGWLASQTDMTAEDWEVVL